MHDARIIRHTNRHGGSRSTEMPEERFRQRRTPSRSEKERRRRFNDRVNEKICADIIWAFKYRIKRGYIWAMNAKNAASQMARTLKKHSPSKVRSIFLKMVLGDLISEQLVTRDGLREYRLAA